MPSGLIVTVPLVGCVIGAVLIVIASPSGSPSLLSSCPLTGWSWWPLAVSSLAIGGVLPGEVGSPESRTSIVTVVVAQLPSSSHAS